MENLEKSGSPEAFRGPLKSEQIRELNFEKFIYQRFLDVPQSKLQYIRF